MSVATGFRLPKDSWPVATGLRLPKEILGPRPKISKSFFRLFIDNSKTCSLSDLRDIIFSLRSGRPAGRLGGEGGEGEVIVFDNYSDN